MNSNPQNSFQNLYLQQLMSMGSLGASKTEDSPDSQAESTTPNAGENANVGGDEMANFMASLIASTTAPTATTPGSFLDQLSMMQNLLSGNVPTTNGPSMGAGNPFTSTASGNANSGMSTPMTPNSQAAAILSSAGLLNSPSGLMGGGFMSPNKVRLVLKFIC